MKNFHFLLFMTSLLVFACQNDSQSGVDMPPTKQNIQGYWLAEDSTGYQFIEDGEAILINRDGANIDYWSIEEGPALKIGFGAPNQPRTKELTYEIMIFNDKEMGIRLTETDEKGPIELYRRISEDSILRYIPTVFGYFRADDEEISFTDCLTGVKVDVSEKGDFKSAVENYNLFRPDGGESVSIKAEAYIDPGTNKLLITNFIEGSSNLDCTRFMPDYRLVWIGPERRACDEKPGLGCLQAKFFNQTLPYGDLTTEILGFDHERGYEYQLIVEENSDTAGAAGYRLKQIIDRELVKPNVDLLKMKWRLIAIEGQAVPEFEEGKEAYIYMYMGEKEGKIEGFSGCNPVVGTFALRGGDKIDLGLLLDGTDPCPKEDPNLENTFLKNILLVTSYEITGDQLTFYKKETPILEFEAMYYQN